MRQGSRSDRASARTSEDASAPRLAAQASSRSWSFVRSERVLAAAALGGVFTVAALAHWWTRAPLYNPPGTIDPWLYTALFVNFDQIYPHFMDTYYAARLPWIAPGRIAYGVLPVDAAYWVLHGLAFVGGVTALFVLVRRYLGLAAAVVGAATLALTPMYWNAHYWDYVDGVTLTYVLAGLCFGLPLFTGRRRAIALGIAGIFLAAAVTTNLFVLLVAAIYPILYAFVQPAQGVRGRVALALRDSAALLVGGAMLVLVLGLYARANGGPLGYFQPQIDIIRAGVVGDSKLPDYEWLRSEPRLLVPPFLITTAAPILVLGRRLPTVRFAAGSLAGLAFLTTFIYLWEFAAGGATLEYTYYFSYFSIPIALAMASIAAVLASLARSHASTHLGVVGATGIAAVLALVLIYRGERDQWIGPAGTRISLVLMAIAAVVLVGALVTHRLRVGTLAAVLAAGAVAGASHFAINSSSGTFDYAATAPDNRDLYHAALDHVAFVKHATAGDKSLPAFWYRGVESDFASIQSMFFFAYSAIGWDLPSVTKDVRERLALIQPRTIVMLCGTRDCRGGAEALRRAGYSYVEERAERITEGDVRFWAVVLRDQSAQ